MLEDLECLVEDVYGITLSASFSALEVSDSPSIDSKLTTEPSIMEEVEISALTFVSESLTFSALFIRENLLFSMMK